MPSVVPDEDLVRAAADDLAYPRIGASSKDLPGTISAHERAVIIGDGIGLKVQSIRGVESAERVLPRFEEVEGLVGGHPQVLGGASAFLHHELVGGNRHDRRFTDTVPIAVFDVGDGPWSLGTKRR